MAITKSKQVWLHPLNRTPEITEALGNVPAIIKADGIVSTASAPRAIASVLLCLDPTQARKISKRLESRTRIKAKLEGANAKIMLLEDGVRELRKVIDEFEGLCLSLKSEKELLQRNLDILRENINDKELMLKSAMAPAAPATSGTAKLIEYGGVGKPLEGGLPGLGKKS